MADYETREELNRTIYLNRIRRGEQWTAQDGGKSELERAQAEYNRAGAYYDGLTDGVKLAAQLVELYHEALSDSLDVAGQLRVYAGRLEDGELRLRETGPDA